MKHYAPNTMLFPTGINFKKARKHFLVKLKKIVERGGGKCKPKIEAIVKLKKAAEEGWGGRVG